MDEGIYKFIIEKLVKKYNINPNEVIKLTKDYVVWYNKRIDDICDKMRLERYKYNRTKANKGVCKI